MRVLVTGANGQLGRCLQDRLPATGFEWRALARHELDIADRDAVLATVEAYRPDVIINAAAYTAVDRAESEPDQARTINAQAVHYLAEAANAVDALLVQVSTDYVFDGTGTLPYRESDPVAPLGVYGATKLAGEQAAATARRYWIVRTAWVFSEYGNNFLKTILRLGAEREQLRIVADQIGTPTYAGDLADGLLGMAGALAGHGEGAASPAGQAPARREAIPNGIYHFCGGRVCSWFEFAQAIFDRIVALKADYPAPTLIPITTGEFPTPARRPGFSVLDGGKLAAVAPGCRGDWEAALPAVMRALCQTNCD